MSLLEVDANFDNALAPDIVTVDGTRVRIESADTNNHFYFHVRITNRDAGTRTVSVHCRWFYSAAKYGLFPEVKRTGVWQRIKTSEPTVDDADFAEATLSVDLAAGEVVALANTPRMSHAELERRLSQLAGGRGKLLALGTSPAGRAVTAIQFGDDRSKPRLVVVGTPQAPEYGDLLACAVAEHFAKGGTDVDKLLATHRVQVVPMPNPDDKRPGCKDYRMLFDFANAAEGNAGTPWHAQTLWRWLAEDPPDRMIELHSETRLKQAGRNRVYVVQDTAYKSNQRGKLARRIADTIDDLPNGHWLTLMNTGGIFAPTLLYQAAMRLDTITISYAPHIRYGLDANIETTVQAVLALGDVQGT